MPGAGLARLGKRSKVQLPPLFIRSRSMAVPFVSLAGAMLLMLALAAPSQAIDWKAFDDPEAVVLTDPLANSIEKLPKDEKSVAITRLRDSLKSREVEIRRRAALTLGALGDKAGEPTLIEDLSATTGRDRDNVVVALRILKDERAIPALRKALGDKSPYVRSIAVSALGEMK